MTENRNVKRDKTGRLRGGDRKVEDWKCEWKGDGMLEDVQGGRMVDFEDGQVITWWAGCLKIDRLREARQER